MNIASFSFNILYLHVIDITCIIVTNTASPFLKAKLLTYIQELARSNYLLTHYNEIY